MRVGDGLRAHFSELTPVDRGSPTSVFRGLALAVIATAETTPDMGGLGPPSKRGVNPHRSAKIALRDSAREP